MTADEFKAKLNGELERAAREVDPVKWFHWWSTGFARAVLETVVAMPGLVTTGNASSFTVIYGDNFITFQCSSRPNDDCGLSYSAPWGREEWTRPYATTDGNFESLICRLIVYATFPSLAVDPAGG